MKVDDKIVTKKKKILFIVEAMGGGVFTYIVDLANELITTYDIYIAYAIRKQTPLNYKDYFNKRIKLIEVKYMSRSINVVMDLLAIIELRKIAKKVKPDIIHLHSSKAGVLGRVAFNGKSIPLFYTPHGYSFLMQNYKKSKRIIFKIIEIVCSKRRCMTISCSKGEYKEALKLTKNAIYINNGINLDILNELINNAKIDDDHPFTVFTLGRICEQKNPKLFNKIAKAMPNINFLWIGEGELRKELTSSNIEITGWCERQEAIRKTLNAEVFLLTSLWEGLPMSLLESMYMKKICIINKAIENCNVICNGKNGFVCKEIEDFVNVINLTKYNKNNKLAECAYHDVLNHYNIKIMAEQYKNIYEGVL